MDTAVKCNNYGSSFISRLRGRKHYLKCQPIVNIESEAETNNDVLVKSINEVIQDSVHYIEYITLLGNVLVYLQEIYHVAK